MKSLSLLFKKYKLFIIFSLAFLVRLIFLNQSLWLDEAVTAKVVQSFNLIEIITKFSPYDFHPPLYYLILRLWTTYFGYSEISLRSPSILFSLIAGFYVYNSISLSCKKCAVWGAVFFLFNPLIIYYSQEARMYMLSVMFVSISLFYFLRVLNSNFRKKHDEFLLGMFLSLAFLSFYGSIFIAIIMQLYILIKKGWRSLIYSLTTQISTSIIIVPLFLKQVIHSQESLSMVKNWSLVLGRSNLKNLTLIFIKFAIGRISFYPKIIYWSVAFLWSFFIFFLFFLKKKNILVQIFILVVTLVFFVSFFVPMLQYFRLQYLIIILSYVLSLYKNAKLKYIIVSGFLVFSLTYLLIPQFHREDWKKLSKNIHTNEVYMIKSSSDPLTYYLGDRVKIKGLKEIATNDSLPDRIVIIPYTSEIHGCNYKKYLMKDGYKLIEKNTVRGLELEEWDKIY